MLYCSTIPAEPMGSLLDDWALVHGHAAYALFQEWCAYNREGAERILGELSELAAGMGDPALTALGRQGGDTVRLLLDYARERPAIGSWGAWFHRHFVLVMGHQIPGGGEASMGWHQHMAGLWSLLAERGVLAADDYLGRMGRCMDQRKPYRTMFLIPARGGSKGVPRKALKPLGGRPLITYTVEAALAVPGVDHVVVSTDDPDIRQVALDWGAEAPFLRPDGISGDESPLEAVYDHCLGWYREHLDFKADIFCVLSPTHPFRRPGLLEHVLHQTLADPEVMNASGISPVPLDPGNVWEVVAGCCRPYELAGCTGERPVYLTSFSFALSFLSRFTNVYYPKKAVHFIMNEWEGIDIDTPFDYIKACACHHAGHYPLEAYG